MKALILTDIKQPLRWEERPDLQPGESRVVVQLNATVTPIWSSWPLRADVS